MRFLKLWLQYAVVLVVSLGGVMLIGGAFLNWVRTDQWTLPPVDRLTHVLLIGLMLAVMFVIAGVAHHWGRQRFHSRIARLLILVAALAAAFCFVFFVLNPWALALSRFAASAD